MELPTGAGPVTATLRLSIPVRGPGTVEMSIIDAVGNNRLEGTATPNANGDLEMTLEDRVGYTPIEWLMLVSVTDSRLVRTRSNGIVAADPVWNPDYAPAEE